MKKGKTAGITIAIIAGICLTAVGVSALIRSNAEKQETKLTADAEVQTGDMKENAKKDDTATVKDENMALHAGVNASVHAAEVVPT